MLQKEFVKDTVREITDEEVSFYEEHGWVMLEQLVSKDAVSELLKISQTIISDIQSFIDDNKDSDKVSGKLLHQRTDNWLAEGFESNSGEITILARNVRLNPFLALTFDKKLGLAAARLINRASLTDDPIAIRYLEDALLYRTSGRTTDYRGTSYHQDTYAFALDRIGAVNLWIALDELVPEQGTMRFLDKSHRAGPLGDYPMAGVSSGDTVLKSYPKLEESYSWTPPFHYQPGDATAHHQMMIHGAQANITANPRIAYLCTYMAADCVVDGPNCRLGLPEPHERFPQVYP